MITYLPHIGDPCAYCGEPILLEGPNNCHIRVRKEGEKNMVPAILKVGTWSSLSYWLKGNKPLKNYKTGDRITFRPQLEKGAKWEHGVITGYSIDMPLVDRL